MKFDKILAGILDIGEIMLVSGAEVNRVEDTMQRMAKAFGCSRVDVFTITSSIVVTVHRDGEIYTQTRRIKEYRNDIARIEACNALSRKVCRQPMAEEDFLSACQEVKDVRGYPLWVTFLSYIMITSSFAVFFGGNVWDALAAALSSVLLFGADQLLARIRMQRIVTTIICSAVVALSAVGLTQLHIGNSVDMICIGNVMILIPGISFTTSLRDMISGDTISGLLGLCEALLRAVAIALGFALILWPLGV